MSQSSSPGSTPGSRRGHKRKRVALSEQVQEFESHSTSGFSAQSTSSGNINIEEIDQDGKFIKLHNGSDEVFCSDLSYFECLECFLIYKKIIPLWNKSELRERTKGSHFKLDWNELDNFVKSMIVII